MGRAQGDDLHFDAAAQAWKNIRATIQLIRRDRVVALAGRVVYPLRRENPVPDITGRSDFGRAYAMLFDSTLKVALMGLTSSDLFGHWGDWSYGGGDVWFNSDGTLGSYTITFLNGPWTYIFDYTALADSGDDSPFGLYLHVLKNGKKIGRYACVQVK
jgi:hypothetical protein